MILRVQRESYLDINLIHIMLADSLLASVILEKMLFYFRKHFWMADKSVPRNHLVTHTDGPRFTYHRNCCLFIHKQ